MTDALYAQAIAYLSANDCEKAIALLQQCIQADPAEPAYYWHLGLAYLLQDEESEAQSIWLSVLSEADEPEIDRWTTALVAILTDYAAQRQPMGDWRSVERLYRQILEITPDAAGAYCTLADAIAQQGRYDEAIDYWQSAIELQPDAVDAYRHRAIVFQKLGQFTAAAEDYLQVLARSPQDAGVHHQLGLGYMQQQNWDAAIVHLQEAIQLNPDNSEIYGDLGIALLYQGNLTRAIEHLQTMAIRCFEFVTGYVDWVNARVADDRSSAALNLNAKFLNAIARNFEADSLFYLAQLLSRNHEPQAAIACWQAALRLNPQFANQVVNETPPQPTSTCLEKEIDPSRVAPLQGFCPTTHAYFAAHPDSVSERYTAIVPRQTVPLRSPQSLTPDIHFSFRFGDAIELPASFVATLANGQFWLSDRQDSCGVITADHYLMADLSPEFPILSPEHPDLNPANHRLFCEDCRSPLKTIHGSVAVLSGLLNDVYFHWMLDVLPRLELLKIAGWNFDEIDYFIVNTRCDFQRETLLHFGIPESKWLDSEHDSYVQADRLIVPSFPASLAWMPKWTIDFLQQHFLPAKPDRSAAAKRFYISRDRTSNRRVVNEAAVIHLLKEFGFESIHLEGRSVQEQAVLLSQAEAIVAPHGSGLTNIAFCQPGTKIIEIFAPNYVYPCYWFISNLAQLDYYYLLGRNPEGTSVHALLYPSERIEDIYVNLNDLKNLLSNSLM